MANLSCSNVTSNHNRYSDPVPVIGLYVAGGTMLCFLFIIYDVIHAICRKKPWVPCKLFSLNSIILSLLAIIAKLPVDLTTEMPSPIDQLSKLTGTTVVCICMSFLYPSLGGSRASETVTNMAALTIFVVTVVVNICIQMSTGLISSFIPEHAVIMFLLLSLLSVLWLSTLEINVRKELEMNRNKEIFAKAEAPSMLERLKKCYLGAYRRNPQFLLCKRSDVVLLGFISLVCVDIVLQATLRSLILKGSGFFTATSDYGWSMSIIVVAQILLILLGGSVTIFRGIVMWTRVDMNDPEDDVSEDYVLQEWDLILLQCSHVFGLSWKDRLCRSLKIVVHVWSTVLLCPFIMVLYCRHSSEKENQSAFEKWTRSKSLEDMKTWMRLSKSGSINSLTELLSRTSPSKQSIVELKSQFLSTSTAAEVPLSCLHLVFLVKVASAIVPPTPSWTLTQALNEVFATIHFIDSKMNSLRLDAKSKCRLARALRMGSDFAAFLAKKNKLSMYEPWESQPNLVPARGVIPSLREAMPYYLKDHMDNIMRLIEGCEYTSVDGIYSYMEQLFVDMLHIFLPQLPEAIFKEVAESQIEEREEKLGFILRLLSQIKPLEGKVQWCFPDGSNITSLTVEASSSEGISNARVNYITPMCHQKSLSEDVYDTITTHVAEDVDYNVCNAEHDEIIEVG